MNLYASSLESWRVRADAVFQRWDDILWDDKETGFANAGRRGRKAPL